MRIKMLFYKNKTCYYNFNCKKFLIKYQLLINNQENLQNKMEKMETKWEKLMFRHNING